MKKKTKKTEGGSKRRVFSEGLSKATQRSYDTKDSFGGGVTYLKKDVKVNTWNCTDGEHLLDVIPYVAGSHDPNVKAGEPQYVLDLWVHRGVGALQQSFVCPQKNFKSRCPICEKQLQMRKSGEFSDEEIKDMQPKRRTLYNVFVWDSKEEIRKGVQVWEVSHFFFEKHIAELCKRPKGGGFIIFSDPDNGKSISFKKKSKGQNMEFLGHRFEDRDEEGEITDDMLEAALVLDDLIHIPTIKELQKAVEEGFADSDSDDDDDKPRRGKKRAKADEDDEDNDDDEDYNTDDDDDDDDDEDEKPKKKGSKKSSAKKKKVEDDDDDDEDFEDEEEDEKPAKKKGKQKPVEDDDDEDDDFGDDDDDDDEEDEKPKKKANKKPVDDDDDDDEEDEKPKKKKVVTKKKGRK